MARDSSSGPTKQPDYSAPDAQPDTGGGEVRIGLVGERAAAEAITPALAAAPGLRLMCQSGMPRSEALPGVEWIDDRRVLLAQGEIAAILLLGSPRLNAEFAPVAAEHGVHVWCRPPLGRNFAEATEVVRICRAAGVVLCVASWWEHVAGEVARSREVLEAFHPDFSELRVGAPGPVHEGWRISRTDTAGGVLASDGYAMLEALLAMRGLPESVQAALGRCRRKQAVAPRETEEVAAAALLYEAGGLAQVLAAWDVPPMTSVVIHHGDDHSLRLDDLRVDVLSEAGESQAGGDLPGGWLEAEMRRFFAAITQRPAAEALHVGQERHLAVSALLESIYLAARTGQPEFPRQLYEVQKWPAPRL